MPDGPLRSNIGKLGDALVKLLQVRPLTADAVLQFRVALAGYLMGCDTYANILFDLHAQDLVLWNLALGDLQKAEEAQPWDMEPDEEIQLVQVSTGWLGFLDKFLIYQTEAWSEKIYPALEAIWSIRSGEECISYFYSCDSFKGSTDFRDYSMEPFSSMGDRGVGVNNPMVPPWVFHHWRDDAPGSSKVEAKAFHDSYLPQLRPLTMRVLLGMEETNLVGMIRRWQTMRSDIQDIKLVVRADAEAKRAQNIQRRGDKGLPRNARLLFNKRS